MPPISVDQLMQDALPEAWKDGHTSALALSVTLSTKSGRPIPWTVLRRSIDDAIKARWIELGPGGGAWPCDMPGAAAVILKQPTQGGGVGGQPPGLLAPKPKGVYTSAAILDPSALQDLVDVLPGVVKAAAGVPLRFQLQISLGDGESLSSEMIHAVNKLLEEVAPELKVKS